MGIEHYRIGFDAVPPLAACGVLDEIDPGFRVGDLLVLMSVPLSKIKAWFFVSVIPCPYVQFAICRAIFSKSIKQPFQNIQLVVEVVEDDQPRMLLENIEQSELSRRILVDDSPPNIAEDACVLDRLVPIRIPPRLSDLLVLHSRVVAPNILMMSCRRPFEVHVHEYLVSETDQATCVNVSINSRILGEARIYDMFSGEFASISIEAVGKEYWDVVGPCISRSSRQEYPLV